MHRGSPLGWLFGFLLLAPGLQGQQAQPQPGSMSFIYILTAKSGMARQLEDGMKKHLAWHTQAKDARSYTVSVVTNGDGVGQYRVVYGGVGYADWDAAAALEGPDVENVNLTMGPFLESVGSLISTRRNDLSRIPATEPPKARNQVTYVYLRPGKGPDYANYLLKVKEAHEKANSSYRTFVLSVVVGPDTPTFTIVRPFDKWAELTPLNTPQVLTAAYGELEANRLMAIPGEVIRRTTSFVTAARRDLSYTPAGQ
jgi:hypothetical protein